MSKSKINFPEVRKNLQTNPSLFIQIPPSNTIWDTKSSHSSRRMDITGETPHMYANIDPTNFNNMSNLSKSSDGEEILKLYRIPCYARPIQQVLSDRKKLEYFLTNNTSLMIDLLTSYDLIKEQSTAIGSEDNLFTYEHIESLKEKAPNQQTNDASSVFHYNHDVSNVDTIEIGPNLKINTQNVQSPKDNISNRGDDQWDTMEDEEEDYSDLILSSDHFKKGKNNKDNNIIQDENHDDIINQQLTLIINESFKLQPNWIIE